MVECERCHKNFVSYSALSQHFDTKHHNAQRPAKLERELATEKELKSYTTTVHYAHGPSKTKIAIFLLILIVATWDQSSGPQYSKVLSDQNLAVSRAYGMLGPNVSMMPGSAPGHSFVLVNKE